MEAFLGRLPGAEDLLAAGPPWWFGFHAVPGLAEQVPSGHEAEYVDWFLTAGTQGRGIPSEIRDAFVAAYTGTESLRCAFEHYRAMPTTARQLEAATTGSRLATPTLAIGATPSARRSTTNCGRSPTTSPGSPSQNPDTSSRWTAPPPC